MRAQPSPGAFLSRRAHSKSESPNSRTERPAPDLRGPRIMSEIANLVLEWIRLRPDSDFRSQLKICYDPF